MICWEPNWRTHGMPEKGDYIQVAWSYRPTEESGLHEGLVTSTEAGLIHTAPEGPLIYGFLHPHADRWRKGALPEADKIETREEEFA